MSFSDKLSALRSKLVEFQVDAAIVPRADEHLGEYVPPSAERLAWLTGFTGSAGLAAVTLDRAAVFSDGRYTLQLAAETDPALWERRHLIEEPAPRWLAEAGAKRVGYDPWLIADDALRPYAAAGLEMVALASNPVDTVWTDRPAPPAGPASIHALDVAGRSSADKRAEIAGHLRAAGIAAAVLSDPASVNWLFNIRGEDVGYTPFLLGFAILHDDASAALFVDPAKIPPAVRTWLGNEVTVAGRDALPPALADLRGRRVRLDTQSSPAWFAQRLREARAEIDAGLDPCMLPKACKNDVEQEGARAAHLRDGIAVTRFLHWLDAALAGGETVGELSAAARLLAFRHEMTGFRGESFPAITGAGEHGAIVHYRASPASDRKLGASEVYLIDSGGQYDCGTTDITRTIWTGPDEAPAAIRDRYTRVMRGHVAIARLVFPVGLTGAHIDGFARAPLWQAGLDYDHGTGHGVGSYLSVHEGPVSLSRAGRPVPLAPGMILSDEPGYYETGAYGIRIENLVLARRAEFPAATRPFLGFETLSLAPYDLRLLDPALLAPDEIDWIDAYQERVRQTLTPYLEGDAAAWLAQATRKIATR
jgi:Xaa-Pro aminopeptidase